MEIDDKITKVENKAKFFMNFFTIFWGTYIFFLIQNKDSLDIPTKILSNLSEALSKNNQLTGFLTTLLSMIILFLIPMSIISFCSIIELSNNTNKKREIDILKIKTEELRHTIKSSFMASLFLIINSILLYFFQQANTFVINNEHSILGFFILIFFIIPSGNFFIKNIKDWKSFSKIIQRISEITGVFVGVIFIFNSLLTIIVNLPILPNILSVLIVISMPRIIFNGVEMISNLWNNIFEINYREDDD